MTPPTSLSTDSTHSINDQGAAIACGRASVNGGADSMLETSNVFQPSVMDFGEQFDNSFIGFKQNEHDSMDIEVQADEEPSILQMQKAAARFLLTHKEQHRLTQVAINYLVSQVKEIVECIINDVKTGVEKVLVENSFVTSNDDLQCFNKCYENTNPSQAWKLNTDKKNSTKTILISS